MNDVTENDFVEFFGFTREELLKHRNVDGLETRREAFHKYVAGDPTLNSLFDYYNSLEFAAVGFDGIVPNYFRITETRQWGEGNYLIQTIKSYISTCPGVTILDHGCGMGQFAVFAASLGAKVTLADLPTRGFRFLQYLCKKYRPEISFVSLDGTNSQDLGGPYEFIISNEVLEHTLDPPSTLKQLTKHMTNGGLIYLSTFFNDLNGLDPSHLYFNNIYQDGNLWLKKVTEVGLIPCGYDPRGVLKLFRKGSTKDGETDSTD